MVCEACGKDATEISDWVLILVLMEYGLRAQHSLIIRSPKGFSLNPCFNGIWSASPHPSHPPKRHRRVLILVLMEYGLRAMLRHRLEQRSPCLNPCFNGIWSARPNSKVLLIVFKMS